MARKYVITVATIFFTMIFVLIILNYKELLNSEDVVVDTIEYSQEDIAYTKAYGDIVNSIILSQNDVYEIKDTYTLFYDEELNKLFGYEDSNNLDAYIKFSIYNDEYGNIGKITVSLKNKTGEEFIYGEIFFDMGKINFYMKDNLFSTQPTYGYCADGKVYCFDTINEEVVDYKNIVLDEGLTIYKDLLNDKDKDFDEISESLMTTSYGENVNSFIPSGYEIVEQHSIDGNINYDEYEDKIVVFDKKYNFVDSSNNYVYPRIAIVLFGDQEGHYSFGGFLSNLISPKSAVSDEDMFVGFLVNKNVISVRNNFEDGGFNIQKYWLDDENRLQLIGYTKGVSEYDVIEKGDKYFVSCDYNLLNGDFSIDFELRDEENNKVSDEFFLTNIGKRNIYYDTMKYDTDLDIVEETKADYYDELSESLHGR